MKIIQILGVLLSLLMYAHGAKVTWGADGKPIIEGSSKPLEGCTEGGLKDLSKNLQENPELLDGDELKRVIKEIFSKKE